MSIPCTIYESRSKSYSLGGGIILSPNALKVLDSLGVYERVRDKGFHFDTLEFKDGDGKTTDVYYLGSEELYGYKAFRIIRELLIDELKAMLQERGVEVRYNTKFSKVISESSEEVVFELADGSTWSTSLLIGSDGIHSAVRTYIHPQATPKYSGLMAITSVVPRSKLRIPDGYHLPATVMGKPGAFLLVPQQVDGSELLMGSQRRFEERDRQGWERLSADKQGLLDMLREDRDDWPDIVQSALEGAPLQNMGIWPFYGIPKLETWASPQGRVVIVGDAAHAIPPTAGQGVNQAFEDIYMLALLLSKLSPSAPLAKALVFWQTFRQERVEKVLDLTKQLNAKPLPPAEQAKLPPGAIWSDEGASRGEGGQLRWLYQPELRQEVDNWFAAQK